MSGEVNNDNVAGFASLDAMIAAVRGLPGLTKRAAPGAAIAVKLELERTIAAGTTPDGEAWLPTTKGKTPLRNAAQALAVYARGTSIVVKLRSPEARHHYGYVRGGKKRQIIPKRDAALPPAIVAAVCKVVFEYYAKAMAAAGEAKVA